MAIIHATLRGVFPILMNPMTDEILDDLWAGSSKRKIKVEQTPAQAAEKKIIRDPKTNKVGIPAEYLLAALVTAGRFVKYDARRNMSTADSSLVPAFVFLEDLFYPFNDQEVKHVVDKRRGVLNNGGKEVAVCIVRPRFDTWEFDVTVGFADIGPDKVKQLFEFAGKAAGLGDFRPSCRGPFGRFTIAKWEVVEDELKAAA